MADDLVPPERLDVLDKIIESWLAEQLADNVCVAAVDRDTTTRRWFVRMTGEEKATFTLWLTLGQRTLQFETYVMPAPEENHAELYEHLLRRNVGLYGATFAIGEEDAVFLVGQLPLHALDDDELDRILGTMYEYTERFFRPALRIGYASRFA